MTEKKEVKKVIYHGDFKNLIPKGLKSFEYSYNWNDVTDPDTLKHKPKAPAIIAEDKEK